MSIEVRIPKLGMSTETATLSEKYVENGAHVTKSAPLCSVEIDKSTTEVDTSAERQVEIIGEIDAEYEVGALIARIA